MTGVKEHLSVMGYHALKATMASQELALTMAEIIFKDIFGEDDSKTQLPLKLTDGGDRWLIKGSRNSDDYPTPEGEIPTGRAVIEILKANCQVLKLLKKQWPLVGAT